jgi:hypothetical protein
MEHGDIVISTENSTFGYLGPSNLQVFLSKDEGERMKGLGRS